MSTISPVTRRHLVASAAASVAGATAVNAAAILAAKAVEADPIFAAIEQHRAAEAEWTRLVRIADELSRPSAKIGIYGGMRKPMTFTIDGKATEYSAEPFYLRTHEEIDKQVDLESARLLKEDPAAWIAGKGESIERRAALHTELQRQGEAATTPEHEAANTAHLEAGDAEYEALQAFITTAPTTPRGLSAMLAYLLEGHMGYAIDQDDLKTVLTTLAVAVASMAGA